MKLMNKDIIRQAMARIEYVQGLIKALDDVTRFLGERDRYTTIDAGNMKGKLYEAETQEWRNVFMWGLTLDDADRAEIKALAHARYIKDDMDVSHWLDERGITPSQWLRADEDSFRKMAKEYFGTICKEKES